MQQGVRSVRLVHQERLQETCRRQRKFIERIFMLTDSHSMVHVEDTIQYMKRKLEKLQRRYDYAKSKMTSIERLEPMMMQLEQKVVDLRDKYIRERNMNEYYCTRISNLVKEQIAYASLLKKWERAYHRIELSNRKTTHDNMALNLNITVYKRLYLRRNSDYYEIEQKYNAIKDQHTICVVCMQRSCNCLLLPCSHASFCTECVNELYRTQTNLKCPICRTTIDSFAPYFL